ncbi:MULTISPECIES: hypothetical protein [Streptomyces]|uniref:hypothetical protein n=1 Tax=Streptomyces TaxID=1883 RepID=UPI0015FF6EAA|nr:hypothetical protein [Streptomyces sp. gCLA4]MBZ9593553.1 hypothetical protein [Streptomyces erythrochromogenes]
MSDLPDLLSEIWLPWDPKTVPKRGVHALEHSSEGTEPDSAKRAATVAGTAT